MKDIVNIGVIGLGEIGQAHCDSLLQVATAKIVAVADINLNILEKTANRLNIKGYLNYQEMLAHPGLDAVIVATPDQLHMAPCVDAARAGKHILVEKPIATSLEDAHMIVDAASQSGVKLMVGFTLRFFPQYQFAHDAVARNDLGKIVSVFARRLNLKSRQEKIKGRTGVLYFLGVHDFDVIRWIIGSEPERIYCVQATSVPGPYPDENETFTTIQFKSGVIACAHIGWFLPENHPAGFDFKLDITGSKGVLNLDMIRQGVEIYTQKQIKFPYMATPLVAEDRAFTEAVRLNLALPVNGYDGIVATKMVIAALKSLDTKLPVILD